MGKYAYASCFKYTNWNKLILSESWYISPPVMIQVQLLASDPCKGHLRSSEVANTFLSITFDKKELQPCAWSHCVCLVKTHWLICNMTYFDLFGSQRDLDLRSSFQLDLSRSTCMCFDASRREKHDGVKINFLSLLVQKLFEKNYFRQKRPFWPFLSSGALTIDLSSILTTHLRKNGSRAIECFFPFPRSYHSFWDNGKFPEKYSHSAKFDLWWPLVTSILTWAEKMTRILSKWFLTSFERFFPFVATCHRSWDRRGGWNQPPPPRHGAFCQEARPGAG